MLEFYYNDDLIRLWTVADIAKDLGVTRDTVMKWTNSGKIPYVQTTGAKGIKFVLDADYQAYKKARNE